MENGVRQGKIEKQLTHDAKFDIVKCILSFFVVAIHVPLFPTILFPWLRIAVPLFFIITGYFLFSKLKGVTSQTVRRKIVRKFARRNLKLYFFWFICLSPLVLYTRREVLFGDNVLETALMFAKTIFFGSTFTGSWYIMSSILGALFIVYALDKIPTMRLFWCVVPLYVLLSLISSYPSVFEGSKWMLACLETYKNWFGSPTLTFPVAIVWLVCGKCFAEDCFRFGKRTHILITLVSAALLYAEWHFVKALNGSDRNDCYLLLLPICIGLFGWIKCADPVNLPFSIHLKCCSTVVYTMHGAVNRIGKFFYDRFLGIDSPVLCFLTTCVVCVAAYAIIALIVRRKTNALTKILRYAY